MPAGERHALTYEQLKGRFSHIAPGKLQEILRDALRKKQAESALGLTSLLQRGVTSHCPNCHRRSPLIAINKFDP